MSRRKAQIVGNAHLAVRFLGSVGGTFVSGAFLLVGRRLILPHPGRVQMVYPIQVSVAAVLYQSVTCQCTLYLLAENGQPIFNPWRTKSLVSLSSIPIAASQNDVPRNVKRCADPRHFALWS